MQLVCTFRRKRRAAWRFAASQRGVTDFQTESRTRSFHSSVLLFSILILWVPSVARRRADGSGPRAPHAGAREGSRAFRCRTGCPVSGTPAARSEPGASRRARHRGRVLFGYFLLHEQEKVPRRPGWPVRRTGCGSGKRRGRCKSALTLPSPASGRGEKLLAGAHEAAPAAEEKPKRNERPKAPAALPITVVRSGTGPTPPAGCPSSRTCRPASRTSGSRD